MSNSFEKQIKDKLNSAEMTPSEGLLDSIFEKRAVKARPSSALGMTGWILAASIFVVTAGVWFYYNNNGSPAKGELSQSEIVQPEAPQSAGVPDNLAQSDDFAPKDHKAPIANNNSVSINEGRSTNKSNSSTHKVSQRTPSKAIAAKHTANHSTNYNESSRQKGFNSDVDPNSYFNVDAKNRPVIDRERHQGNSHMYVYQSVDPLVLDEMSVNYTSTKGIKKFKTDFGQPEDIKYAAVEIKKKKSPISKYPYFIDVMYNQGVNTLSASSGFHPAADYNATKSMGAFNQFGLRVSRPLAGPWTLFAGLNQTNLKTVYNGALNYSTNDQVINTNVHFINDPIKGVIRVETKDTHYVTNVHKQNVDHTNTYSLFRMPIGLGYNFAIGKLEAGFLGSIDMNYLKSSNGFYYDYENHSVKAFSNNKGSLNIGASMSFMAMYKLSNKFGVFVEPGLQFVNIRSKNSFHAVNERVNNYNIGFGLRYIAF